MRLVLIATAVLLGIGLIPLAKSQLAGASRVAAAAATSSGSHSRPEAPAVSDGVKLQALPAPTTNVLIQTVITNPPPAQDVFRWDSESKVVDAKTNEASASFVFFVTNVSSADVVIHDVVSSCGCTAAKLPSTPYKLAPGDFGKIEIVMDLLGRAGPVIRTVTVLSSVGPRVLTLQANVPFAAVNSLGERLLNQRLAKVDRQFVFRGECAKCHLEPAQGKMGEALFTAACGVCHLAKDRASAVPDLALLRVPTGPDYWRLWITYGKLGTMMPAWAQDQGGPLSAEQISSLVEYLNRRYPARLPRK